MATATDRPLERGRRSSVPASALAPAAPPRPQEPAASRRARALAGAALAALFASGAAIAVGAAGGPSPRLTPSSAAGFPGWLAGPLAAPSPGPLPEGRFWLLLLAMSASYLALLTVVRAVGMRTLAGAVVLLHVVFALAPPLLSTDAFGYLAVARAVALPGASPYASLSHALGGDPVLPLLVWQTRPNPYGPLFTAASAPLAALGLAGGLWAVKALAATASLGLVALVGSTARRLGREARAAVAFVGLNPVLLVWAVGGAHNDTLLMVLVVGALALLVVGRERAGGAALAAATAVKASVAALAPILVLGARRRDSAVAGLAAGLAACGAVALAVVGPGVAGFPAALADQAALRSPNSVLHALGTLLGLPGATPALRAAGALALAAVLAVLYVRTARGADPLAAAGWATVATLLATSWLMPWYLVWALPLAALAPGRALRAASLALCAFVVAMRAPLPLG
jgi:hypothetical protein